MTIQELQNYKFLKTEVEMLKKEIEQIYDTYKSPIFDSIPSNSSSGVKVEKLIAKADVLKDKYNQRLNDLLDKQKEIEEWITTVDNVEVITIVRLHFMNGYSWKQTSAMIYGKESYYNARKVFYRFFEKN